MNETIAKPGDIAHVDVPYEAVEDGNGMAWMPRIEEVPVAGYHPSIERFLDALDEVRDMHLQKGKDYGRDDDPLANVRGSEAWGIPAWQGAMIRANDKVVRLQTFAAKGELANEPVEDAFLDLATYALIGLVLYREGRMAEVEA